MNLFRGIGRRHLWKESDARRCQAFDFGAVEHGSGIRSKRRAVRIIGVGREAKPDRRGVAFAASRVKLREPRGAAQKQYEHAGRQGIERAEMADLAESKNAASGIHDVMRRSASRLVNDQGAVQRRGLRFSWHGIGFVRKPPRIRARAFGSGAEAPRSAGCTPRSDRG